MKFYRFDEEVSHQIAAYGSQHLAMSRIVPPLQLVRVDVMHIGPEGLVGGHEATENQIFAVVRGEGWVRTSDSRHPIRVGQAAFWTAGEWHESGSDSGMTVIVIEGPDLNPEGVMTPDSR